MEVDSEFQKFQSPSLWDTGLVSRELVELEFAELELELEFVELELELEFAEPFSWSAEDLREMALTPFPEPKQLER